MTTPAPQHDLTGRTLADYADALVTAISSAREAHHTTHGKCSMCAVGDAPVGGFHRGEHRCGNAEALVRSTKDNPTRPDAVEPFSEEAK
jgi:hypothetical protein